MRIPAIVSRDRQTAVRDAQRRGHANKLISTVQTYGRPRRLLPSERLLLSIALKPSLLPA